MATLGRRMAAVWRIFTLAVFLVTIASGPLRAEEPADADLQKLKEDKTDYEFGGQILTLTEPKTDVVPTSDNPRFQDNQNGTVTDLETQLIWFQLDSYQVRKQWVNWHKAQDYIRELNKTKFGEAATRMVPMGSARMASGQ